MCQLAPVMQRFLRFTEDSVNIEGTCISEESEVGWGWWSPDFKWLPWLLCRGLRDGDLDPCLASSWCFLGNTMCARE